ncbi:MAG: rhodanese-like domain-containing protein [Sulfuriferula sp.]|nr:rhodanese-like domain-containing protein [Sulfuriferula sp.]
MSSLAYVRGLFLAVASSALIAASPAFAGDTPTSLKGAEVVDAAKAKSLMDAGAKMIDARVAAEYADAHIKGAINVPYREKSAKAVDFDASQDSFDLGKLPADKNAAIILACNGPECWKSYKGAIAAIKGGYKKVYWFRGGFPEWKAKGLPIE